MLETVMDVDVAAVVMVRARAGAGAHLIASSCVHITSPIFTCFKLLSAILECCFFTWTDVRRDHGSSLTDCRRCCRCGPSCVQVGLQGCGGCHPFRPQRALALLAPLPTPPARGRDSIVVGYSSKVGDHGLPHSKKMRRACAASCLCL